jgi:transposase InsO family protein
MEFETIKPNLTVPGKGIMVPIIFNSDQGSQFTSREFTSRLELGNIRISMDGS